MCRTCEGYDLTQTPLVERKEVLARLVLSANPNNEGAFRYSDHIRGQGENVLQQACRSADGRHHLQARRQHLSAIPLARAGSR